MRLILATNNQGKLREMRTLASQTDELDWLSIELPPSGFNPEETGFTFAENALIKAQAAANICQSHALSDDSGICVDALEGRPGVFSARYAADDYQACLRLIEELKSIPVKKRTATYHCVMTLVSPQGKLLCQSEGIWSGRIIDEMRGGGGFGYDPIFFVDSHNKTAAEISLDEKNKLSHRAQAFQKIKEYLVYQHKKLRT